MRAPISAFIISFNEEDQIAECLESVRFCDEVLVVDSFSTDRTVEIAQAFGARVIQHPWGGYLEQKRWALTQTSNEWVINIDADERVSDELRKSIELMLERANNVPESSLPSGYAVNRLVFHLGRWWRRGGWFPEYRLRVFRKSQVTWGGIEPHEKPLPHGRTDHLKGDLFHFTYEDFTHQIERLHHLSLIAAKVDFERGEKATVHKLTISPLIRIFKFYVSKRGYREGVAGLIVALAEGYYTFLKYAKVWEYQTFPKKETSAETRREALRMYETPRK